LHTDTDMKGYVTLLNEMNGYIRWQLISSAIKHHVFDHIKEWTVAGTVAGKLGGRTDRTEIFLDALVSCGYLEKCCGRYRNSSLSARYLVSDSEKYQGRLVLSLASRRLYGLDDIMSLIAAKDAAVFNLGNEPVWTESFENLIPFQKMVGLNAVETVVSLEGLNTDGRFLDLGGGPGFIGISILDTFPSMSMTLFDLPSVIEMAQKIHGDRISYISGSYSKDDIGSGYDLIWASRSLYYADDLHALLCKIAGALNAGGYFISVHEGLYNEKTQPQEVIISRLGVALSGSDVSFGRGEIEDAVSESGLTIVGSRISGDSGGEADVIIARKP